MQVGHWTEDKDNRLKAGVAQCPKDTLLQFNWQEISKRFVIDCSKR